MFSVIPPSYALPSQPGPPPIDPRLLMEAQNRLEEIELDDYQLSVGEGTYQLKDSIALGVPLPHHSELTAPQPPNPLDTQVKPPTAGTKLSLVVVSQTGSNNPTRIARPDTPTSNGDTSSQAGSNAGNGDSHTDQNDSRSSSSIFRNPVYSDTQKSDGRELFGHKNPALGQQNGKEGKEALKKQKKPKSNILKTNSTFVARVQAGDGLSKRLAERNPDGIFAFANINRSFQWLDLSAADKLKADALTKIFLARSHPLCHDLNQTTASANHIDIVIGFSTGDIIWYDPISQKYSRINKNGIVNSTAVHDIKWMPGSQNLFIASHSDGTMIVYDKEKEDAAFVPDNADPEPISYDKPKMQIYKSVNSQQQKTNPVAYWRVSKQRINSFVFSPCAGYIAAGSEGGRIYIIDHHKERILDSYVSFFGGTQAICWSPDGRYILSGGQDDMISIISMDDREMVARCQGHGSWISHIAFDPWRCDGRNYRFGSVAQDRRLLFWDFNASMLQRPRAASIRQRTSIASNMINYRDHNGSLDARLTSEVDLDHVEDEEDPEIGVSHPPMGWKDIPKVPPIMEIVVDNHELSWLGFHQQGIITSCSTGHVRMWDRPKEPSTSRINTSENRHKI